MLPDKSALAELGAISDCVVIGKIPHPFQSLDKQRTLFPMYVPAPTGGVKLQSTDEGELIARPGYGAFERLVTFEHWLFRAVTKSVRSCM